KLVGDRAGGEVPHRCKETLRLGIECGSAATFHTEARPAVLTMTMCVPSGLKPAESTVAGAGSEREPAAVASGWLTLKVLSGWPVAKSQIHAVLSALTARTRVSFGSEISLPSSIRLSRFSQESSSSSVAIADLSS